MWDYLKDTRSHHKHVEEHRAKGAEWRRRVPLSAQAEWEPPANRVDPVEVLIRGAWAITPSGTRGVLNDAPSIYFLGATLASALVARWCAGHGVETAEGVFGIGARRTGGPGPAPTGL